VLLERSLDSHHLSNAYLVGDRPGGIAVFVDSGAPLEPLLAFARANELTPTHVLRTHSHIDHVIHETELDLPVVTGPLRSGGLTVDAIPTPGHSKDMICFVVADGSGEELAFSGDTLFRDSIGGGEFAAIRHAVMDVYMAMPHERRLLPGHTDASSIGREWEHNPFIGVWRGVRPEDGARVSVRGVAATLVVWSPDYDGKGKAWVRFDDGRDAIVGGSSITR
jgi:hydroxyacylglutathione hydrolase